VPACKRRHLMRYEHRGGARFGYEEATITCTQVAGVGNAKVRAKALWRELKPLLKVGRHAAVEARVLWACTSTCTTHAHVAHQSRCACTFAVHRAIESS